MRQIFIFLLCLNCIALTAQEKKYNLIISGRIIKSNLSEENCQKELSATIFKYTQHPNVGVTGNLNADFATAESLRMSDIKVPDCKCIPMDETSEVHTSTSGSTARSANEFVDMNNARAAEVYNSNVLAQRAAHNKNDVRVSSMRINPELTKWNSETKTRQETSSYDDYSQDLNEYGLMSVAGQSIGLNINDYLLYEDYFRCLISSNELGCEDVRVAIDQFWKDHRVWSDKTLQKNWKEVDENISAALMELGINIAEISVTTYATINYGPSGQVVVAGAAKALFECAKAKNRGESLNNPEVLRKIAISAGVSAVTASIGKEGKGLITTKNATGDIVVKMLISGSGEYAKGEGRTKIILKVAETGTLHAISHSLPESTSVAKKEFTKAKFKTIIAIGKSDVIYNSYWGQEDKH